MTNGSKGVQTTWRLRLQIPLVTHNIIIIVK